MNTITVSFSGKYEGHKLAAIKALRNVTGLSLREGKAAIENIVDYGGVREYEIAVDVNPFDVKYNHVRTLRELGFTVIDRDTNTLDDYIALAQPLLDRAMADRNLNVACLITEALKVVKENQS